MCYTESKISVCQSALSVTFVEIGAQRSSTYLWKEYVPHSLSILSCSHMWQAQTYKKYKITEANAFNLTFMVNEDAPPIQLIIQSLLTGFH